MQQPDNQTTASAFNLIAIECSNLGINCLSSDRGGAGCNAAWHRNNRQCIWWHRHQMQPWQSDNRQRIWSFHGRVQQFWHQNNLVSASDRFTVGCSISDINSLPAHSSVAASHSFDHFFTLSGTIDRLSYTFIWSSFFKKKHQSSAFRSKITFISYVAHAASAKDLRNKDSQSTSKHVFYVSANDHFNVSANDHFKRSFRTVIPCSQNGSKLATTFFRL